MAILENGPNGGFRGKAGSYIGYQIYGKWVIRGIPKLSEKNKKGSTLQKVSRSRFTLMQHFLSPLLYFLRVGFKLASIKNQNSAYNSAKSYNMLNAFDEQDSIIYEKICLTQGRLTGAEGVTVEKDDVGLHFSWVNNSDYSALRKKNEALCSDQVMLVAYNVKAKCVDTITSGATRETCRESLIIKRQYSSGTELHLWISFVSEDRENIATSSYLGSIVY